MRAEARAVVVMAVVKEMAGTVEAKEEEVRAVATAEEVRVAVVMVVERVEVVRAEVTLVKLRFSLPDCTSILSG